MTIISFEVFKNAKKWEDDYPKFLGTVESFFGSKTDAESNLKRLYYATRYLKGISKSIFILNILGLKQDDLNEGKKLLIPLLEDVLYELRGR